MLTPKIRRCEQSGLDTNVFYAMPWYAMSWYAWHGMVLCGVVWYGYNMV